MTGAERETALVVFLVLAVDGLPDPVRVRFAWHSDDHIAQLVAPAAAVLPLNLAEKVAA